MKQIPIELIKIEELALDKDKCYIVDLEFCKGVLREYRAACANSLKAVFEKRGITKIVLNISLDVCKIKIKEKEQNIDESSDSDASI